MENLTSKKLNEQFSDSILDVIEFREELTFIIKKKALLEICEFLKNDTELQYNFLSDVCGVDYPEREKRFEVVYNLYSISNKLRVRLKINVGEGEPAPSITSIWSGANWPEREVFDMFGIEFENHPDLTRILMPDDWVGHPLRKDFPLTKEEVTFTHNQHKPPKRIG
ncbi:MAG: NADH-quinone oxidoreductase subunit C [Candidatus Zixiibacteriota bacterium]